MKLMTISRSPCRFSGMGMPWDVKPGVQIGGGYSLRTSALDLAFLRGFSNLPDLNWTEKKYIKIDTSSSHGLSWIMLYIWFTYAKTCTALATPGPLPVAFLQEWKSPNNQRSVPGLRQLSQVYPHRQIVTWLTTTAARFGSKNWVPHWTLTDSWFGRSIFRRILEAKRFQSQPKIGVKPLVNSRVFSEDHIVLGRIFEPQRNMLRGCFWGT